MKSTFYSRAARLFRNIILAIVLAAGWPGLSGVSHAEDLPEQAFVSGLIGHAQHYGLTCEARSASDWSAFWGVPLTEEEILAELPPSDNPEIGFVGRLSAPWGNIPPASYGVHPPPVAAVLRDHGLPAQARVGLSWDDLRREIVAGRPVIVWIVGFMWNGTPVPYTAADGQSTIVAAYEHTMILTGYTPRSVEVVDSSTGAEQSYPVQTFLASWAVLGQRAITGQGQPLSPSIPHTGAGGAITVRAGETLSEIAREYQVPWRELAAANGLHPPYWINPGQTLQLPASGGTGSPFEGPVEPTGTSVAAPQAVTPKTSGTPPVLPQNVTVQRGDTLIRLARRYGLDWHQLAQVNGIRYPYIIHPGEVLQLAP